MANRELDALIAMQHVVQRSAFGEFHGQKHVWLFGAGAKQADNVGVRDARQLLDLIARKKTTQ